jgi:hypothetical protein
LAAGWTQPELDARVKGFVDSARFWNRIRIRERILQRRVTSY